MQPISAMEGSASVTADAQKLGSHRRAYVIAAWVACAISVALLVGTVGVIVAAAEVAAEGGLLLPAIVQLIAGEQMPEFASAGYGLYLIALVTFAALGALIVAHYPRHLIGWLFCALGLVGMSEEFAKYYAIYALIIEPGALPLPFIAAWVTEWSWTIFFGLLNVLLPLLFPNGCVPSRRWRPVAWFGSASVLTLALAFALKPGPFGNIEQLSQFQNVFTPFAADSLITSIIPVAFIAVLISMLLALAALVVRLRYATGDEQQQLKWLCYPVALLALLFVVQGMLRYVLNFWPAELEIGASLAWSIWFISLPVAASIAILKYRLYEIDLIINRTLVYGALSSSIVGMYVIVVGSLGALFQARGNLAIALLATALVALIFQPLREWLQRSVNRVMYGDRDDPYTALARLSQRMEAAIAPNNVLPAIAQTVQETLKLPYVAIALDHNGVCIDAASVGAPAAGTISLPLVYGGEQIGELLLGPRVPREPFSAADMRLLNDIAHQTGVAAHALRLTADLQRSRERLVAAREEERRRLRRDLHDGLGPALATQTLKLEAARDLVHSHPERAEKLMTDLIGASQAAIADIRRLVYALRPPALDELGLLGALHEQAAQYEQMGLGIILNLPEHLPALSAAVEVAAYRIAQEALTNVVRHAHVRTCTLRLIVDETALHLEIIDDGCGLPETRRAGVGLSSMRERAAELGGICEIASIATGGASVRARLPL